MEHFKGRKTPPVFVCTPPLVQAEAYVSVECILLPNIFFYFSLMIKKVPLDLTTGSRLNVSTDIVLVDAAASSFDLPGTDVMIF
jgi:hypothetical protein